MTNGKFPKAVGMRKVSVDMTLLDGSVLKGTVVVIGRTARLSDTLNNPEKEFIVLSDNKNNHHMVNKRHILKVLETESLKE